MWLLCSYVSICNLTYFYRTSLSVSALYTYLLQASAFYNSPRFQFWQSRVTITNSETVSRGSRHWNLQYFYCIINVTHIDQPWLWWTCNHLGRAGLTRLEVLTHSFNLQCITVYQPLLLPAPLLQLHQVSTCNREKQLIELSNIYKLAVDNWRTLTS